MWPSLKGEHWDSVLDRLAADDYAIIDSFLPDSGATLQQRRPFSQ